MSQPQQDEVPNRHVESNKQHRAVKTILILAVAIPIFFVAKIVVSTPEFRGFVHEYMTVPDPESEKILKQKDTAKGQVASELDILLGGYGYHLYETSEHNMCNEGVFGWKRHTDYHFICAIKETRFFGFDGEIRGHIASLEGSLESKGWLPEDIVNMSGDMTRTLGSDFRSSVLRAQERSSSLSIVGLEGVSPALNFDSTKYLKSHKQVGFWFIERGAEGAKYDIVSRVGKSQEGYIFMTGESFYDKRDFVDDTKEIMQKISSKHRYTVLVFTQAEYFRK